MLHKKIHILLIFILALPFWADAQVTDTEGRTGSVYSGLGLGMPVDFRSPMADGMGLTGVAITDSDIANLSNPALLGDIILTRGSAGFSIENFEAKTSATDITNTSFKPHHFQLEFPLSKNKLGFSFSMSPITRSSFRVIENNGLPPNQNITADSLNFDLENQKEGGVNRFEMGVGWKINNSISVGYGGSVYFGSIDNAINASFQNRRFEDLNLLEKTSVQGFGNRFGLLLTKKSLFRQTDKLKLGINFNLPVDLDSDRDITTNVSSLDQTGQLISEDIDIEQEDGADDGEFRFPLKLSTGITYEFNKVWSVGSELVYQKWSQFENFDGQKETFMKDRYRLGLGTNYYPFERSSQSFFSKFKYRAGVTYDSGHLQFNGNDIDALFLNAGFSFLSRGSRSSIDFNFHYGIRGTRADGLVKENIMGMKITFNLSELMFERRKLR